MKGILTLALVLVLGTTATYAQSGGRGLCPLLVGDSVPSITVLDVDGKPVDLRDVVAKRPTILIFYRGGWCPYCNLHLNEIADLEPELLGLGYQIVGISADRPEKLRAGEDQADLHYTLLSDSRLAAASAFGLTTVVPDSVVARYREANIDIEDASGEKHHMLPVPAAFIIRTDGVIVFTYVNPDYRVRVDADILFSAAQNLIETE